LQNDSRKSIATGDGLDFALLMDGLEAEREQKITIDVAYRYFSTNSRSFIVADTPGHEQYTRNMATGASTSDLALLLIDARKGIQVQSLRHTLISSLFGIRHVVLAVNKIDLVDYSQRRFNVIVDEYMAFTSQLPFKSVLAIPVSARFGDNIASMSAKTTWYEAPPFFSSSKLLISNPTSNQNHFDSPSSLSIVQIRTSADIRGRLQADLFAAAIQSQSRAAA
jgi:bifunctional enzyme CysN/CysC